MSAYLTINQERYVRELLEGKSQRQAYIAAYPKAANWKPEIVDSKASTLFANGKVRERYDELQAKAVSSKILTCIELKEFFTKVINSAEEKTTDRLKAAELLGKTQAMFTDKVQVTDMPVINEDV